jgi:hypothetical protein
MDTAVFHLGAILFSSTTPLCPGRSQQVLSNAAAMMVCEAQFAVPAAGRKGRHRGRACADGNRGPVTLRTAAGGDPRWVCRAGGQCGRMTC